jgi:hypothetical protein
LKVAARSDGCAHGRVRYARLRCVARRVLFVRYNIYVESRSLAMGDAYTCIENKIRLKTIAYVFYV